MSEWSPKLRDTKTRGMSAYDVWDLAKRLLLEVFCTLMLALVQIDRDQLERDFLLGQHSRDPFGTGRWVHSMEFKNHRRIGVYGEWMGVEVCKETY
jgi:hypothetical protein